jgi:hypothetical protein
MRAALEAALALMPGEEAAPKLVTPDMFAVSA